MPPKIVIAALSRPAKPGIEPSGVDLSSPAMRDQALQHCNPIGCSTSGLGGAPCHQPFIRQANLGGKQCSLLIQTLYIVYHAHNMYFLHIRLSVELSESILSKVAG